MQGEIVIETPNPGTFNATLSLGKHGRLYLNRQNGWNVFRKFATPFATEADCWEAVLLHTPETWTVTRGGLPIR